MPTFLYLKKLLIFSLCFLVVETGFAQLNNSFLYSTDPDSLFAPKVKFGLYVDNVNYLRNTEYHSVIEHGATWAGTQIWPQAFYRYNRFLSFRAGVFLQKDFGNHQFRTLIPTYTLTYTQKRLKVNFGTLDGSLDHQLIEPLYAMENFIDKRIENGLQVLGQSRRLKYDVWIDWEKMIYRNSTSPERFTAGVSSKIKLLRNEHLRVNIPVQMTLRHQGGEIYLGEHSNIQTQMNLAYGLQVKSKMPGNWIDELDFQGFLTFYEDLAPSKTDSFWDGSGQYVSLRLSHKNLGIMLNYLDAHQYIAPLGEPLYVSKSRARYGDYLQYRKMYMARLMYEMRKWEHFTLVARVNNIYDVSEKAFHNVVEMYAKIDLNWQ